MQIDDAENLTGFNKLRPKSSMKSFRCSSGKLSQKGISNLTKKRVQSANLIWKNKAKKS